MENDRKKGLWKTILPISRVLVLKLSLISATPQLVQHPRYQKFVVMGDFLYFISQYLNVDYYYVLKYVSNKKTDHSCGFKGPKYRKKSSVNPIPSWCKESKNMHYLNWNPTSGFLGQSNCAQHNRKLCGCAHSLRGGCGSLLYTECAVSVHAGKH